MSFGYITTLDSLGVSLETLDFFMGPFDSIISRFQNNIHVRGEFLIMNFMSSTHQEGNRWVTVR